jgi:hypothetical protein
MILCLYIQIKVPKKIKNKFERIEVGGHLFIALFTTLILPDIVFGMLYGFVLNVYDTRILESDSNNIIWEFSYFSFLIHYALPVKSNNIEFYIQLLNEHTLPRVLQVIHIIICKFLDLTFIGFLMNNIFKFIGTFKVKNNY